jgi:hypothetical protein
MLETCLKRTQFYVCGRNQENHNLSCPWIMPQTITLYEAPIFKLYGHEILPTELQDCELLPQSSGAVRYLAKTSNKQPVFQLKPDLVSSFKFKK